MHSIVLKHQSMSEYIIIMIMVNHLFCFLIQVSTTTVWEYEPTLLPLNQ